MDLWRVIVFAIVKQCMDLDYDALLYRATNDLLLRGLLGHGEAGFDALNCSRQRLVDNVQLLTPELIDEVIHLIVRTGNEVTRKKSGAALRGRCDSRVVKTHVHYPTDVSLCWDAVPGLIRVSARSAAAFGLAGWRKHADRTRKVHQAFSRVRTAPRYRLNPKGVKAYLRRCTQNAAHARTLLNALATVENSAAAQAEITYYLRYVDLLVDQIRRRTLLGREDSTCGAGVFYPQATHALDQQWQSGGAGGACAGARLHSRQRGGSIRQSNRVWPILDVAAGRCACRCWRSTCTGWAAWRATRSGSNKAPAKARGVGSLPPRRKVLITDAAQGARDTYALPIGIQPHSSRKLPVRERKRHQPSRNTRSGRRTNSKNDRTYVPYARQRGFSVNHYAALGIVRHRSTEYTTTIGITGVGSNRTDSKSMDP